MKTYVSWIYKNAYVQCTKLCTLYKKFCTSNIQSCVTSLRKYVYWKFVHAKYIESCTFFEKYNLRLFSPHFCVGIETSSCFKADWFS